MDRGDRSDALALLGLLLDHADGGGWVRIRIDTLAGEFAIEIDDARCRLALLQRVGAVEPVDGGWRIAGFAGYRPTGLRAADALSLIADAIGRPLDHPVLDDVGTGPVAGSVPVDATPAAADEPQARDDTILRTLEVHVDPVRPVRALPLSRSGGRMLGVALAFVLVAAVAFASRPTGPGAVGTCPAGAPTTSVRDVALVAAGSPVVTVHGTLVNTAESAVSGVTIQIGGTVGDAPLATVATTVAGTLAPGASTTWQAALPVPAGVGAGAVPELQLTVGAWSWADPAHAAC